MADFDNLGNQAEGKIVSALDGLAFARTLAWILVALNGVYGVFGLLTMNLIGGALGLVTACVLVWLLVKTRAPKVLV